jgi:hypothetical protein
VKFLPNFSLIITESRRQRTSPIRKASLFSRSDGTGSILLPTGFQLDSTGAFKYRVLSHITELEKKTFIGPFERIWLCVLRLGLDPFDDVAKMGERIINYIFDLSAKIKEARNKALEINQKTPSLTVDGPERPSSSNGQGEKQQETILQTQQSQINPVKIKWQEIKNTMIQ